MSVIDVATEAGNFTILLSALDTAGLTDTLADLDATFTVFAPSDDVFTVYLEDNDLEAADLLGLENLSDILLYHVIAGAAVGAADAETGAAFMAAELSAWVAVGDDGSVMINGATVSTADIEADNGVIHAIDGILLPANILEFVEYTGLFETLAGAVVEAGLDETLTDDGAPVTLFAPTDGAFAQLLDDLGLAEEELLQCVDLANVLRYHITTGQRLAAGFRGLDGQSIAMLNGDDAEVLVGAAISVGGAVLSDSSRDISVTNGVIHFIRSVMLPQSFAGCGG